MTNHNKAPGIFARHNVVAGAAGLAMVAVLASGCKDSKTTPTLPACSSFNFSKEVLSADEVQGFIGKSTPQMNTYAKQDVVGEVHNRIATVVKAPKNVDYGVAVTVAWGGEVSKDDANADLKALETEIGPDHLFDESGHSFYVTDGSGRIVLEGTRLADKANLTPGTATIDFSAFGAPCDSNN